MQISTYNLDWIEVDKMLAYHRPSRSIMIIKKGLPMIKLHRIMQEEMENFTLSDIELSILDENPTIRHTDHIIEMDNSWCVINIEKLCEGTLIQYGENYTPKTYEIGAVKNVNI